MKKQYTEKDFIILEGIEQTHSDKILYEFVSKDKNVDANFFWVDGDVQIRYLISISNDCFSIGYPFAYSYEKKPNKEVILKSFLRCLNIQLKEFIELKRVLN